ncbi:hypothetical protein J2S34_002768 [Nitrobacter winogradskyi]|uniref:Uncharacterized protein n=1 Tax=Nitrobacter winogradskyi TaxID=913 RepID=A0ACC6AKD6_NITWI|nr:hypothetical protein [Nitrobacter winogradskyi]
MAFVPSGVRAPASGLSSRAAGHEAHLRQPPECGWANAQADTNSPVR